MRGEFKSTLDAKGRMNFPIKLREELGGSFFISKSLGENCIKVYSKDDWHKIVEKFDNEPQTKTEELRRYLFGSSYEVEPDKQGRVLIPPTLREYAQLQSDVVIVGLEGKAEIWDKGNWDRYNSSLNMNNLMSVALEMGL